TMKSANGEVVTSSPEGTVLTKNSNDPGHLVTAANYRPPFTIHARAKTDLRNVRLYYGTGRVIFNWDVRPGELGVNDPVSGQTIAVHGKGRISTNQRHESAWEVQRTGMRVLVDAQLGCENHADYSKLEGPAGIGSHLSKVTVASFTVEKGGSR